LQFTAYAGQLRKPLHAGRARLRHGCKRLKL
jgi:hypothetical protein